VKSGAVIEGLDVIEDGGAGGASQLSQDFAKFSSGGCHIAVRSARDADKVNR
jgi:hypothetical protein